MRGHRIGLRRLKGPFLRLPALIPANDAARAVAVLYRPPMTLAPQRSQRCAARGSPCRTCCSPPRWPSPPSSARFRCARPAHPWTELVGAVAAGSLVAAAARAPGHGGDRGSSDRASSPSCPAPRPRCGPSWPSCCIAFSAGAHPEGRRALLGVGLLVAAGYVIQFATDTDLSERLVTPPVLIGAPALAGWLLRRSRRQSAALRRLAAELTEEQERRAEAVAVGGADPDRPRAARRHRPLGERDGGAGRRRRAAARRDPDAGPAATLRRSAGDRPGGAGRAAPARSACCARPRTAARAPRRSPRCADLLALVEEAADAELTGGDRFRRPPVDAARRACELAAYRIVQEALTNARRHASGAAVR